jgi:putative membrane protein
MMWSSGSWGWGAWLAMSLAMIAFWAFVAWVIVMVVRGSGWAGSWSRPRTPFDVLDERYARGEIDEDEYRRRRDLISPDR